MFFNCICFLYVATGFMANLIRDIYCGSEVLFKTCIAMKFVDDDDDDDDDDDGSCA